MASLKLRGPLPSSSLRAYECLISLSRLTYLIFTLGMKDVPIHFVILWRAYYVFQLGLICPGGCLFHSNAADKSPSASASLWIVSKAFFWAFILGRGVKRCKEGQRTLRPGDSFVQSLFIRPAYVQEPDILFIITFFFYFDPSLRVGMFSLRIWLTFRHVLVIWSESTICFRRVRSGNNLFVDCATSH